MALGINYETVDGGDIVPVVKYNAKAGRWFRVDRDNGQNDEVELKTFRALFDFENVETGHIHFDTGKAPEFCLSVFGKPTPTPPSDKFKPGIRIIVKLSKDNAGDKDAIREIAATSKAFLEGIDDLHDLYLEGVKANPGKLPLVTMTDTKAITSEGKGQKSTNYSPIFAIEGWKDRPVDLVAMPRVWKGPATSSSSASPPSTGSTKASPPAKTDDDEW